MINTDILINVRSIIAQQFNIIRSKTSENKVITMDYIPESPYDRMKPLRENAALRLKTFEQWPSNIIGARELVNDYFYYIGIEDKCQCTQCGGVLGGWRNGDIVHEEHHRHFPDCPFILDCIQNHGLLCTTPIKYPDFASEAIRLQSYEDWPVQLKQKPKELAEAGLFYMKTGDRVTCFYCGGMLWNWESDDVPEEEHAKWFPTCGYVDGLYRKK